MINKDNWHIPVAIILGVIAVVIGIYFPDSVNYLNSRQGVPTQWIHDAGEAERYCHSQDKTDYRLTGFLKDGSVIFCKYGEPTILSKSSKE